MSDQASGRTADKTAAVPAGVKRHLLVVDDDRDFADSLSHLLTLEGYRVSQAYSLSSALALLDEIAVEVALIDIRLGEHSGLSLIADVRKHHPEAVCVMITAYASAETAIEALQEGAYDYLCKPFFSEDLLATLERCFERIALTRSREEAEAALRHRNRELEDINARLQTVVTSLKSLSSCSTLREICVTTLEEVSRNLRGCRAAMYLNDGPQVFSHEGFGYGADEASLRALFQHLLERHGPNVPPDRPDGVAMPGHVMGFPLTGEGRVAVGVLAIRASVEHGFTEQDREFARILASFASEAIRLIQALEHLALSEERLRQIIDHSPSLISLKDLEGRILIVNKCFEEWHGYRQETVGGKRYYDVFPEAIARLYELQFEEVVATGKAAVQEIEIPFSDGDYHSVLVVKFPVFGADGQPMGVGTIGTDITERKRTEERLRQAQKMEVLGQLTRGIAHDFNNLLAVISGNLDLIKDDLHDTSEAWELVEDATSAARSGEELTHRWLAFGRSQVLKPQTTDANGLVAGMIRMLERTLGEVITIEQDLCDNLWPIEIDRNQLETSLLNLAVNARDAMPNGGDLTIRTANVSLDEGVIGDEATLPGDYVLLAVGDNGLGMAPEIASQAVQPFFTTKVVGQGSGLGLSLVHGFVHQSGGYLDISSQPGTGTTVSLYLPRSEVAAGVGEALPDKAAVLAGGGERILVVEDRPDVRKVAKTILTRLGYDVLEAVDGEDAMNLLANVGQIDLLFTDVVLPGGTNGVELARMAQARYPALKVLCASGYPEDSTLGESLADYDFVRKPFVRDDLAAMVRRTLDAERR